MCLDISLKHYEHSNNILLVNKHLSSKEINTTNKLLYFIVNNIAQLNNSRVFQYEDVHSFVLFT